MKKLKTYRLAKQFYNNSKILYLKEPLRSQFERAKLSVVLNIVEGNSRPTAKDRKRFYAISLGSLREVQAILDLVQHEELIKETDVLGAYLYKLWKNT